MKSERRPSPFRQRWLSFWFEPSSPAVLGVCRLLFFLGLWWLYLGEDFSAWGHVSPVFWTPVWLFEVLSLSQFDPGTLDLLQKVWKVSLALAAVGLFTRTAMAVAFVLGAYLFGLANSFGQTYHYDTVPLFAMGALMLSRAPDTWSLDALIATYRRGGTLRSAPSGEYTWPIRFVWVTMALVFFAAGVSKLRHGGLAWVVSESMQHTLIRAHYHVSNADPLVDWGLWIAAFPFAAQAMAAAALITEIAFPLSLVSRYGRAALVTASFVMLVSIRGLMGPTFGSYLFCYVFWVPWGSLGSRTAALSQRRARATVLFDGACGLCRATTAVLRRLDVLRRLSFIDARGEWADVETRFPTLTQADCLEDMHVVGESGAVSRGFRGYRLLARHVPLAWPLVPLLYVPGAAIIGERVYWTVVRNRHGRADAVCASGPD